MAQYLPSAAVINSLVRLAARRTVLYGGRRWNGSGKDHRNRSCASVRIEDDGLVLEFKFSPVGKLFESDRQSLRCAVFTENLQFKHVFSGIEINFKGVVIRTHRSFAVAGYSGIEQDFAVDLEEPAAVGGNSENSGNR